MLRSMGYFHRLLTTMNVVTIPMDRLLSRFKMNSEHAQFLVSEGEPPYYSGDAQWGTVRQNLV